MHITQSGLYLISDEITEITVSTSDTVALLDLSNQGEKKYTVNLTAPTKCYLFGSLSGAVEHNIHIKTSCPDAQSYVRLAIAGLGDEQIRSTVLSQLTHSQTLTDVHIVALAADKSLIQLDGTVQIDAGISGVSGHILEESIFLWSSGKILGIPSLLVRSDDVQAGHAARVERVSDEKLYYLRSRGIPKDDATVMMIESSIRSLFEELAQFDQDQYETCVQTLLSQTLQRETTA